MFSWHNKEVVHIHSQWLWQHAKYLGKQVSQNSSKEVQKWAQNLTTSWGGNFLTVWRLQFQHALRQAPSPRVVGRCKCNSMEKGGKRKEKPVCGQGGRGRKGWIWKGVELALTVIQIHYLKFSRNYCKYCF